MKQVFIGLRRVIAHILILLIIFIAAVLFFERLINQTVPIMAEGMESSSFPLVYIQNNGVSYNCLHGYAYEMDVREIRDTVTVLDSNHQLELQIQPFSCSVDGMSYEILTLDGKESLENTNVVKWTEENNYLYTTLNIQNNMRMNQEYILKLRVSVGGRDIFFYTRLVLQDGLHLTSYLDFVTGFYEKCVNNTDQELGTYVEPNANTGKEKTLSTMDIHTSVNQLMWGKINPQIYYKPTPSLVDINQTTASFVLEYRISSVGEGGVIEVYNIKEFYRLRYTDTRIFLLDFTRTTDEIFKTDKKVVEDSAINLGITGMNVEYKFDEKKRAVAFVQENELWTYRIGENKLSRVFGFPQSENMDYRDFYDKNNIRILSLDEQGNTWFAVSGYMNRGKHEGENGIGLYYYEDASATVQESVFIRSMEAYDMLKLDINTLSYVTENEKYCYLYLDGIVYEINLLNHAIDKVAEGIHNNCYTGSSTGRHFAWLEEGEQYNSSTLCEIDLETKEIRRIEAGEGEAIRQIAFMGEDLVYGVARKADMDLTHEGNEIFPMYRLSIVNPEGEEVKNYQPAGSYVTDVDQVKNMLTLTLVKKNRTGYQKTTEDHIVSTDVQDDVVYGITTRESDIRQTEILLRLGTTTNSGIPQVVKSKILSAGSAATVQIPSNEEKESLYYVYAGGSMDSRFTFAGSAIRRANERVGVVIDQKKQFVWERGNRENTKRIKLENVPQAFREGQTDLEILRRKMKDYDVQDLTGCTLDMVLYFVGQGRAVQALTPTGVVTIVGYDEYNVILLDPGSEETYYGGLNDSTAMFEDAGNVFISYT